MNDGQIADSLTAIILKTDSFKRTIKNIVVVMPAYNAERTLETTVNDIPKEYVSEIVLVDDNSTDDTVAVAKRLGLTVIEHRDNRGYGANQKTCYRYALETNADLIAMIHPDYQYDPRVLSVAAQIIELGIVDVVLGSRIRTRQEALNGGMPKIKYFANRMLTTIQNIMLGQNLCDFHSGFRVYHRHVLEKINFEANSDDFLFDGQFLIQCVNLGFRLGDTPVPVRYFDEASSINIKQSAEYAIGSLWWIVRYYLHRMDKFKTPVFNSKE